MVESRDWDNSEIHSTITGHEQLFTMVEVPTIDLFRNFPSDDMSKSLAGHDNKDEFLKLLDLSENEDLHPQTPKHGSGEVGQAAHNRRKKDYDDVEYWLKTLNTNKISTASKQAAKGSNRSWDAIKTGHRRYRDYLRKQTGQKGN
jgi:hypothetical protein